MILQGTSLCSFSFNLLLGTEDYSDHLGYIGNINGRVTIDIGSIGSWRIAKDNAHKQRYVGNINGTGSMNLRK